MKTILLILIVGLMMVGGVVAQDSNPPVDSEGTGLCVSAWYYPTATFPGAMDSVMGNLDVMDEINPFWYSPMDDGSILALPGSEDAEALTAWREAGLLILPAIFTGISTAIQDEATRAAHVEAIRDLVERMDYDGIDIDYEGFAAETREPFADFIEQLSAGLHEDGRMLSVTVHAKATDAGSWGGAAAQDWERLAPAADVFRIMTYDYTNRNEPPGPIAPVAWVMDVLAYAESVTDLSKVRMGLPFYGYSWQRGNPPATTVTWSSIQNWLENLGAEIVRDPADMEAFIDFKLQGLPRQNIYIADPEGLAFKLDQVLATYPTLSGVSIWGVGGEHPGLWDTLREYGAGC